MTPHLPRIAAASVALALLVGAAGCSSDDKEETGTQQTTTTAATSGDSGNGSGSGGGAATSDDLCTKVPVATVAEITGVKVTTAKPLGAGERADMSSTGPTCSYNTDNKIGGINAEFIGATKFEGFTGPNAITPVEPVSGIGDAAFKSVSMTDPDAVTRLFVNDGDQYLFVEFFSGVPEAKGVELAKKMLG